MDYWKEVILAQPWPGSPLAFDQPADPLLQADLGLAPVDAVLTLDELQRSLRKSKLGKGYPSWRCPQKSGGSWASQACGPLKPNSTLAGSLGHVSNATSFEAGQTIGPRTTTGKNN